MYLLLYGVTNVVFVVGLRVNARWVYPLTIFVSGAFSDYQVYRFNHTHSIAMLPLTISDVAIIYLTWMEWREQKAQKQSQLASLFLVR
jgi:uncharacterized membrane protein